MTNVRQMTTNVADDYGCRSFMITHVADDYECRSRMSTKHKGSKKMLGESKGGGHFSEGRLIGVKFRCSNQIKSDLDTLGVHNLGGTDWVTTDWVTTDWVTLGGAGT